MAARAIPRATQRLVRERAGDRCEYCRHPASYSCAPFACEHVVPRVRGAGDEPSELAWACAACNGHKHAKTQARDPLSGRLAPLYNPRRQRWTRHFAWSEDTLRILGRTATGRATVDALHLNSTELVNLREALRAVGKHPPE